ncbi:hypothetical protein AA93_02930 [Xylella fastidiosa subsp. pauca 11399]|uniref:hypothetical protein n=1 Tax=Xylella fastidiosa TaxID=2371 RepID=UPI00080AEC85|nr:hypothetical protein [Xylella fastidiosa]OCA58596.1 hypothetical protein AA93_02930 [Xylella fastidiosa subsp. pauca 11399]
MYISVAPFDDPVGSLVGEGNKRLIIDIAAGPPAPGNEVSGSYLGLDGPDALVIEAFEVLLRSGFPFSVRPMPTALGTDGLTVEQGAQ